MPCRQRVPPSHLYIKIEFSNEPLAYTLSSGANLDRFSPRFFCRLPHSPEKTTLSGAARQAGAGGPGSRHRDRDDVGPLLAGASETTAAPFFCLPVYIWNERMLARCARGAGLGITGNVARASARALAVAGLRAACAAS